MKKFWKSYKQEFEVTCKVLAGTVREICQLREVNEKLDKENDLLANSNIELQKENDNLRDEINNLAEICNVQSETLAKRNEQIRAAREALAK